MDHFEDIALDLGIYAAGLLGGIILLSVAFSLLRDLLGWMA